MSKQIVVAKFSSSLVASRVDGIFYDSIEQYAKGLLNVHKNQGIIIVTSGAREAGLYKVKKLYHAKKIARFSQKQLAGMGAVSVFHAFEKAFEKYGSAAASFAVTHHQLDGKGDKKTKQESRSFLEVLSDNADNGVVSIINEADAMSDSELMQLITGAENELDNDGLSSHISIAIRAKKLEIWTQHGGIIDGDGSILPLVNADNLHVVKRMLSVRDGSTSGRGGPLIKLQAAWDAACSDVAVTIAAVNSDMTGVNVTRVIAR